MLDASIYWSLVPFTYIGLNARGGIGGPSENKDAGIFLFGGISPTFGLLFPLNNYLTVFADSFLDMKNYTERRPLNGLITNWMTPGFSIGLGIRPSWGYNHDGDGAMHIIKLNISYRGTWYENSYTHGIRFGVGFNLYGIKYWGLL